MIIVEQIRTYESPFINIYEIKNNKLNLGKLYINVDKLDGTAFYMDNNIDEGFYGSYNFVFNEIIGSPTNDKKDEFSAFLIPPMTDNANFDMHVLENQV